MRIPYGTEDDVGLHCVPSLGAAGQALVMSSNGTHGTWAAGAPAPVLFAIKKTTNSSSSDFPITGWATPEFNIGGGAWDGAGTYTVGSKGYYDLNFQAQIQTTSPNTRSNFISLYVNGGSVSSANQFMVNVASGAEYLNMVVSKLIYLSSGDQITTGCTVNNSGVLNNSHLKIYRVADL